jgi:hypothetical protein
MTKAGRRGGGTTPKVSLNERLLLIASAQQRDGRFLVFHFIFPAEDGERKERREERRKTSLVAHAPTIDALAQQQHFPATNQKEKQKQKVERLKSERDKERRS